MALSFGAGVVACWGFVMKTVTPVVQKRIDQLETELSELRAELREEKRARMEDLKAIRNEG